jgi:hypothetical protein
MVHARTNLRGCFNGQLAGRFQRFDFQSVGQLTCHLKWPLGPTPLNGYFLRRALLQTPWVQMRESWRGGLYRCAKESNGN